MGLLKPMKWLGKLFQCQRHAPSTKTSTSIPPAGHATAIAAFPPASHKALKRLVSHASLYDCRQGISKIASKIQSQPARSRKCHSRAPSVDLQQFTRSVAAGREPHSEDVATRNFQAQKFSKYGVPENPLWRPEDVCQTYANYNPRQLRKQMVAKAQALQKEESVRLSVERKEPRDADARPWSPNSDIWSSFSGRPARHSSKHSAVAFQSSGPEVIHASIISLPSRLRSLSRKRSIPDLHRAGTLGHKRSQTFPGADPPRTAHRRAITRADLDKPLPPLPRTNDTTVSTEWAPAVTHQILERGVHHVHQEIITNDLRQDIYQPHILPVVQKEVLPARHFIQLDGGVLEEISEDDVPGGLSPEVQQRISEAAEIIFASGIRDSGVSFPSFDGKVDPVRTDQRDSWTPDGHVRQDTTWTYPPSFLPTRFGSEQHHQLFVHLDGANGGVGSTHVRSSSDGPPPIPPRGVRHSDIVLGGVMS